MQFRRFFAASVLVLSSFLPIAVASSALVREDAADVDCSGHVPSTAALITVSVDDAAQADNSVFGTSVREALDKRARTASAGRCSVREFNAGNYIVSLVPLVPFTADQLKLLFSAAGAVSVVAVSPGPTSHKNDTATPTWSMLSTCSHPTLVAPSEVTGALYGASGTVAGDALAILIAASAASNVNGYASSRLDAEILVCLDGNEMFTAVITGPVSDAILFFGLEETDGLLLSAVANAPFTGIAPIPSVQVVRVGGAIATPAS